MSWPMAESRTQIGAEPQIVLHRQVAEDLPALGRLGDAGGNPRVGLGMRDVRALEDNCAAADRLHAGDGFEQRGLAGAVAADERHDLTLAHLQAHVAQGLDAPVAAGEAVNLEHAPPPCLAMSHAIPDRRG